MCYFDGKHKHFWRQLVTIWVTVFTLSGDSLVYFMLFS